LFWCLQSVFLHEPFLPELALMVATTVSFAYISFLHVTGEMFVLHGVGNILQNRCE
jgi:hypothetical protein